MLAAETRAQGLMHAFPEASSGKREPLLEFRAVSKSFRRPGGLIVRAVQSVSFEVHEAETVALVGESGSGKSTIGRMALCLVAPDEGTVLLAGRSVHALSARELQKARTII